MACMAVVFVLARVNKIWLAGRYQMEQEAKEQLARDALAEKDGKGSQEEDDSEGKKCD